MNTNTTEYVFNTLLGSMNNALSHLPHKTISDMPTDEDELRDELEKERDYLEYELEKEREYLEHELERKNTDSNLFTIISTEKKEVELNCDESITAIGKYVYYRFSLNYNVHTDFWLVIHNNALDLEPHEKIMLLDSRIYLEIGGTKNIMMNLKLSLLIGHLMDKPHQDTGNTIRIPIILTIDQLGGCIDPQRAIYQEHRIILYAPNLSNISYKIEYLQHIVERDINTYSFERNRVIMQYQSKMIIIPRNNTINLRFNNIVKFLFISFIPNNNDVDICNCYDPGLYCIELIANQYEPMVFDGDRLLKVEFMGIIMYAISLCPEMRDWKNCSEHLTNRKHTKSGVNLGRLDSLQMRFYAESSIEGLTVEVNAISINIQKWRDGLTGTTFGS